MAGKKIQNESALHFAEEELKFIQGGS